MFLFLAYAIMAEALAQLAQQVVKMQEVQDQATQTANGLKDKWTGDDADSFQQVVASDVIPGMSQLVSTVTGFGQQLQQAQDRIQQADQEAKQAVDGLTSLFNSI